MKKVVSRFLFIILLLSFLQYGPVLKGCSTFVLKSGKNLVFGRNYDWDVGAGYVMVNKRNLAKKSIRFSDTSSNPAQWVSKYGSITFNQYGKEYPMGGMNEAGLVVEVMWLQQTKFPDPDARPTLDELQWVQFQLDTASRVQDVIKSNVSIRISPNSQPIHFLVSDKTGEAATIEFLDGKMVYHSGSTLPVKALTNSTYTESMEYLKGHKGFGGDKEISSSEHSLDRFARAADRLRSYEKSAEKDIVNYAFSILESVHSEERTQWSIVYDVTHMTIHYKTKNAPMFKKFLFSEFDFACQTPSKVIDMHTHRSGNLGSYFIEYSTQINRELIGKSFRGTEFLKDTPDAVLDQLAKYPESIICQKKK
jgi:penicillin V acylase-like amidase (Ntn superfamily)